MSDKKLLKAVIAANQMHVLPVGEHAWEATAVPDMMRPMTAAGGTAEQAIWTLVLQLK